MKTIRLCLICLGLALLAAPTRARADWPMSGHDPQRTSYAPEDVFAVTEKPLWHKRIDGYIPSAAHIITVRGRGTARDLVYVPCADGIHALNPETGEERWHYATQRPVGNSPTVVAGVLYVGVHDNRVHALDAQTGTLRWTTDRTGAGFDTNPLVVDDCVYTGCRDGFFYCFHAADGTLAWSFETGGPITCSAAFRPSQGDTGGIVYVGSDDDCAYALHSRDRNGDRLGDLIWKTAPLPGDGLNVFWPVVAGEHVVFSGSYNYSADGSLKVNLMQKDDFWPPDAKQGDLIAPTDDAGNLDMQAVIAFYRDNPHRKHLFVLDSKRGIESAVAPFLWWGNPSGTRYPPSVGPDGRLWTKTPWRYSWFTSGRYAGWEIGSRWIQPLIVKGLESADEPEAQAIIGNHLYHNDGGDGVDKGGAWPLPGFSGNCTWVGLATFYPVFGNYYEKWDQRRYGSPLKIKSPSNPWGSLLGHHGYQNPPVPLDGRVYFHRSNSVICMQP